MPAMTFGEGQVGLSWRQNADSFGVAVVANRLAAHGVAAQSVGTESGTCLAAGDFILAPGAATDSAIGTLGLESDCFAATDFANSAAVDLSSPQIAVLAGRGSAYPYYAYVAHSLSCLGLRYDVLDAATIAAGALGAVDLLMLPGGFSIWGLDRSEQTAGVDRAVRGFLESGGACIGSCGGAYYLAQGRPGWLGIAPASPRYTHEYLRGGAGVVSIRLTPGPLTVGCAPAIEMPYYHGPIFDVVREPCVVAGWFESLSLEARIPIDNPLDDQRFRDHLNGRPAILQVNGKRGRAVLFSAHPEMGDIVRKWVAFGSYVEPFLPIRGQAVMEQTLDFYTPNDSPSLRLIHNAVQALGCRAAGTRPPHFDASGGAGPGGTRPGDLVDRIVERLSCVPVSGHPAQRLIEREIARLRQLADGLGGESSWRPDPGEQRIIEDAAAHLSGPGARADGTVPVAQLMLDLEFPLRFLEAALRAKAVDRAIGKKS
ncbi:MAG: hypothetical protein ABIP08_12435 [Lautropia sp.]